MAEIIRVSATGPDGAGKDTAWRNAKDLLSPKLRILKIGKPSSCIINGSEVVIDVEVSEALDRFHAWADSKRSKLLTSMANTLFVMFQWRYQEQFWTNKIKPDLVFSLRDGYADPAAYAPYYMPSTLGRLGIPQRIDALHLMHGSPFRDATIFLDVDPVVSVQRIKERMEREAADNKGIMRPKWVHQHENVRDLTAIRAEFGRVLDHLSSVRGTQISYIDTNEHTRLEVGKSLADVITFCLE